MELQSKLYAAQFFGFTPHAVVDCLHNAMQECLFETIQLCERYLFSHLPPGVTENEVRTGTEWLLQHMQETFNTIFPRLELFLLKHVLAVPSTVLLPEDAVHAHTPDQTATTMLSNHSQRQEVDEVLDAEISELRQQYRDLATVMAKLQAEQEEQRRIEHQMETALRRDDELMSCFQQCQLQNPGLTFSSCLEQAQQLLTQIEQGQEQADAIGLSV
uniref:protein MIS12 homolog n=1 Tax=Myxine glutinosa TaxID=7769 RepID=UPI00358EA89D